MIAHNMISNAMELQTEPGLIQAVQKLASRKMTPHEIREQKISFVFGSINQESGVTKEQVRKIIMERDGVDTEISGDRI